MSIDKYRDGRKMSGSTKIDSAFLVKYKDQLDEVFRTYIEDINPFIVKFESQKNEFPVEVLNEIRAIYGHIVRAAMADNEEDVARNIGKIKAHSKRALLDCLKYIGIIYHDEYVEFMKRYESVDLTYINNGNFIRDAVKMYNESVELWQNAKIAETSNIGEDELYDQYQDAYEHYVKLHDLLSSVEEVAAFLQRKATSKDLLAKRSYYVGIAGVVVGVLGIIIGVLVAIFL